MQQRLSPAARRSKFSTVGAHILTKPFGHEFRAEWEKKDRKISE
jgi:hypothetical protein